MSSPDFAQYARELGLSQALYPVLEAFRLLGVSKSYGWATLIATGVLPVVRLPGGKLTMVRAIDIARFIHEREAETKKHPAKKRVGQTGVKQAEGRRDGRVPRSSHADDGTDYSEHPDRPWLARGGRP
jgi:hypothetical protein